MTSKLKPESEHPLGAFAKQLVFPGTSHAPFLAGVAQLVAGSLPAATGTLSPERARKSSSNVDNQSSVGTTRIPRVSVAGKFVLVTVARELCVTMRMLLLAWFLRELRSKFRHKQDRMTHVLITAQCKQPRKVGRTSAMRYRGVAHPDLGPGFNGWIDS